MQDFSQQNEPDVSLRRPPCERLWFGKPDGGANGATRPNTNNLALVGLHRDLVFDWIGEISKLWTRGAAHTLELALLVWEARKRLHDGQWTRLWQSGSLPFSKREAHMLSAIGKSLGWVNAQTFAYLPSGWSILYCLAQLEQETFAQLVKEGTIHPGLSLQKARQLLARLKGESNQHQQRINVKRRLRQFADFVRNTANDWQPEERDLVKIELTRLIEQIGAGDTLVLSQTLQVARS
jgi:hypothetical protein